MNYPDPFLWDTRSLIRTGHGRLLGLDDQTNFQDLLLHHGHMNLCRLHDHVLIARHYIQGPLHGADPVADLWELVDVGQI